MVIVPTELERSDAAFDIAVGLAVLLGVVYCVKPPELGGLGLPWPVLIPPLLPVALYVLTGEYAGDLPWIGGIAAGLRSKFGARRAHEWIGAFGHYSRVTLIPNGRDRYDAERRRIYRYGRATLRRMAGTRKGSALAILRGVLALPLRLRRGARHSRTSAANRSIQKLRMFKPKVSE